MEERDEEAVMEDVLWLIPVLACPLMMVVMMLVMGKGMSIMGGDKDKASANGEPATPPVSELRAERDRLEREIARRERTEEGADHPSRGAASHV